jgi:CheY-like chemotaxis protein
MNAPRKKVLVIEDDDDVRRLLVQLLKPMGAEVVLAEDGEEGVLRAKECAPDLILLDILMPKLDGIQTLLKLREQEALSKTPIVVLTGNASADYVTQAAHLGASDFLVKPNFLQEAGLDRIRNWLGLPRKPKRSRVRK